MRARIPILMLLLMMAGCCNQRPLSQQHTITDSVYVDRLVTERDTVIVTERVTVSNTFDCDSLLTAFERDSKPLRTTSKNATLTLTPQPYGRMLAECECDTLAVELKLRDTLIKEFRQRNETTITEVPVKYIPALVKYLAYFGGACAMFLLGAAIYKLKRILPI